MEGITREFEHGNVFFTLIIVAYWVLIFALIISVGVMLLSLTKKGDERKSYIKVKTMANAFAVNW
ncbi:hypothetical protein GCM10011391_13380 [Pullulanibacillus camelliae]|uniref:Uncharacterized protein n=1 Tax=Pullulanibacillus camelliae TaxID=1707096 RepID=A0A8J2VQX8_9BACL|nr:hypothetical protein GCM10011391_13380 [Pullulanibacillus camelliae]